MSTETDPLAADFRNFLFVVWDHLNLPVPTPVQYDLAYFMQHGPRRKMIMAFRGVGKSWIYAAFICWRLYCDHNWKIMVVSASKSLADDMSKFVKRLIEEMEILNHLKPRNGQRDSNISFDVGPSSASKDPSVKSVGITGQITGSRADEILADDIESLNNSATQSMREKLGEVVKEFDAVIKPKTGIITYLGTPQSENSMYSVLPERGYEIRIWTARVPAKVAQYKGHLAPFIQDMINNGVEPGTCVDPDRFDDLDLIEREASYGRSGFSLQFMLDTSLSDANRYPLKLSDLIVTDVDPRQGPINLVWTNGPEQVYEDLPATGLQGDRYYRPMRVSEEFVEFDGTVMSIDPSGRGKDETAYAIVRYLRGTLFLVASGGFKGGYEDTTLEKLSKLAQGYGVERIVIESNFGDGMFMKLLQPWLAKAKATASVEEVRATVQKEKRIIDILEPVMNQHKLVVDKKVVLVDNLLVGDLDSLSADLKYSLFYQMTRLTREKGSLLQDDRLDALTMAVAHFVELMARDADAEEQAHKNDLLDKELEKFMQEVGVNDPALENPMFLDI